MFTGSDGDHIITKINFEPSVVNDNDHMLEFLRLWVAHMYVLLELFKSKSCAKS